MIVTYKSIEHPNTKSFIAEIYARFKLCSKPGEKKTITNKN